MKELVCVNVYSVRTCATVLPSDWVDLSVQGGPKVIFQMIYFHTHFFHPLTSHFPSHFPTSILWRKAQPLLKQ